MRGALPDRKYFKVEGIAAGESDNARGVTDDFRTPDANMAKGWALVRCKEASAYVWWGTHREPMQ